MTIAASDSSLPPGMARRSSSISPARGARHASRTAGCTSARNASAPTEADPMAFKRSVAARHCGSRRIRLLLLQAQERLSNRLLGGGTNGRSTGPTGGGGSPSPTRIPATAIGRKVCSSTGGSACIPVFRLYLRWTHDVFSDALLRGGYVLHPQLPQHEDGREQRRGALRIPMVQLTTGDPLHHLKNRGFQYIGPRSNILERCIF